jgi:hypothetical protein
MEIPLLCVKYWIYCKNENTLYNTDAKYTHSNNNDTKITSAKYNTICLACLVKYQIFYE